MEKEYSLQVAAPKLLEMLTNVVNHRIVSSLMARSDEE
jgi:hypothetical protein